MLVVAAGGGGDAITGSALAGLLGRTKPPVVLTYSWDRLMVDPLPGPRTANDFTGLRQLAPNVREILPSTEPISPAGSSLPRLAADLPTRILLLDPAGGAVAMATQISAAATYFHADTLAVIDVGGDALTDGSDPELLSVPSWLRRRAEAQGRGMRTALSRGARRCWPGATTSCSPARSHTPAARASSSP